MRGVFLDTDTVDGGDLDLSPIRAHARIDWAFHRTTQTEQVAERIRGRQIVISNKTLLPAAVLRAAADLELVVIAATGTNNVDLGAARECGITVCNCSDYGVPSVVQHVYALILALTVRLPEYREAVADGAWNRHPHFCFFDFPIRELDGHTLGIVGYGALGRGVAAAAPAFGLEVAVAARPGAVAEQGRIAWSDFLQQVDILSLHCPLTDATRNLIGARELESMKDDALLINTARGGIVDEQALANALRAGTLGGAGVDVLTTEPPRAGNVLLDPTIPNLIVTPHTAWASKASRQRVINIVADNITAFLDGKPINTVS